MKEKYEMQNPEEESEVLNINFSQILSDCKAGKKKIFKITAVFFLFGVLVAFTLPKKYSSSCTFVPQFSRSMESRLSSLASMAGMDLDLMSNAESQISPKVYPLILEHPGLQLDLMHTKLHFENASEPIEIYEYFTDSKYREFDLWGTVSAYTLGLPGKIKDALFPESDSETAGKPVQEASVQSEEPVEEHGLTSELQNATIYHMTKQEDMVAKTLLSSLKFDVDAKKGFLTLTATMPEALASAELCEAAYLAVLKYVGDFRRRKAAENLKFFDEQVKDAYAKYIKAQEECAQVMDSNMGLLTATAKIDRIRKEGEYKVASQLYSELVRQQVTARIRLDESTVAFTEIAAAEVPQKPSSPKKKLLVLVWTFLGFAAGCALVCFKASKQRRNSEPEQVEGV